MGANQPFNTTGSSAELGASHRAAMQSALNQSKHCNRVLAWEVRRDVGKSTNAPVRSRQVADGCGPVCQHRFVSLLPSCLPSQPKPPQDGSLTMGELGRSSLTRTILTPSPPAPLSAHKALPNPTHAVAPCGACVWGGPGANAARFPPLSFPRGRGRIPGRRGRRAA